MSKRFTHLLLAFLLLCAQALAVAHAIEHTVDEGHGTPAHACECCLAAHGLSSGVPTAIFALPILAAKWLPTVFTDTILAPVALPEARQQSPPYA
ncbi:MAG: hypothetical protein K2X64_01000 [Rhodocyclaceae bacterium]|nr:hypothetical protein [Rhodocyclaceae bacterium]